MKKFLKIVGIGFVALIVLSFIFGGDVTTEDQVTPVVEEKVYTERQAIAGGDDLEELTDSSVNVWTSYNETGLQAPIEKIPNMSEVTVIDEVQVNNANGHEVTYYKIRYEEIEGWVGENIITFE